MKFDADFLEARMSQHREWQDAETMRLTKEVRTELIATLN